jgi:PAT family beta-lactamase induction signal transducer AmpG
VLTTIMGLGHSLWVFGALQIISNLGYVFIADAGPNRWIMYSAMGFESLTSGMGTGAFSVLLLRMTQKQFSATQYALFSSLFALPRILAGPITGVAVDAMGWHDFFILTMVIGLPGMVLLHRFSPLGVRDPELDQTALAATAPVSRAMLLIRGLAGGSAGFVVAVLVAVLFDTFKRQRVTPDSSLDLLTPLVAIFAPQGANEWLTLAGIAVFAVLIGLTAAATAAARSRK